MSLSGKCLCGRVSYKIDGQQSGLQACHCTMCRRWSGGVFIGLQLAPREIEFSGADNLSIYRSSDWAERAFCRTCGANMYYRVTAPGPHHGAYHIGSGTLDDHGDLALTQQLFVDIKPESYSFADNTRDLSQAQVEAMFADAGGDADGGGD